jgi:mannose-6-phosphate isomerase-like protein (cupin superfamily)
VRNFVKLCEGIDVSEILAQLNAHPELWDEHRQRKDAPDTPHGEMSDIWVRFRALEELTGPEKYKEPHFAVWYPAWEKLPALQPLVFALMGLVEATYLGGILITKIPPGGKILPHDDRGGWHAEYHNCKVYFPLQSNDGCVNVCEDETVVMRAGEMWTFDNLKVHSVENNGDEDRITVIISMRVE